MNSILQHRQSITNRVIKLLMLLSFLCLSFNLVAQNPNFTASIDRSEVPLNRTFKVTYTVSNANAKSFTAPNFTPFQSLGQSSSTSMNYVNGKMSQSKSYIFTLKPTKEGTFKIPPAAAIIDGKNAKTNSVNIKVVAATAQNNNGNSGNNRQGNASTNNKDLETQIRENLYARVVPSKTSIYEGEQITVSYKMLYRVSLQDISIIKSPSFDGFLSHEIELTQDKMTKKVEEFRGQQYNSSLFKQYAIFPTKAGSYKIDPMKLESVVAIERQTRSWFPQIEHMKVEVASNPLNITVKPLPTAGKPSNFTGAVGDFKFNVEYDKTETQVDEPITLKIKVSGTGNVKLLDIPEFELPSSFEVYDPKIKESITKKSYTVGGSKAYEYLIIPRGGGEFQFPDINFSYFDLKTEKYVSRNFEGPLIKVEGEALENTGGFTNNGNISKEDIELLSSDIKFIKTAIPTGKISAKSNLITRPIFHLFTWLPLLLMAFLPIANAKRKRENKDVALVKRKKAHKEAAKRMALAKKLMSGSDTKAFYNEVVKSIWGYIGDKFNIPVADLSKSKAVEVLTQKDVNESIIANTSKLIDDCEMAIYAPSAVGDSKEMILNKASELIENLEKEIGKK